MIAFHFLSDTWHTSSGGLLVVPGQTLRHDGPLVPCTSGLHASTRAIDALQYARGPVVTLVECGGDIVEHGDKFVCRERTALWGYDATEELRTFARLCALEVIHLWDAPAVVREYLETGDESIRAAAWGAAWGAARDAARGAAWGAALDAALAAARGAAWGAARDAARGAAWGAARGAALDAAWGANLTRYNETLESLLLDGAVWRRLV